MIRTDGVIGRRLSVDDDSRQRELDDLDDGVDAGTILRRRAGAARVQQEDALAELRAVMSDAEVLEKFGIDISVA